MRGLTTAATAAVVVEGHAFIRNIRRGFHDADVATQLRVKHVFRSLTLAA